MPARYGGSHAHAGDPSCRDVYLFALHLACKTFRWYVRCPLFFRVVLLVALMQNCARASNSLWIIWGSRECFCGGLLKKAQ
mmetsp:Transcript_126858/g.283565  ORF Transcript_126858/g.283565 Transcript_126858/m.283565 type:complete len:81 (-) Transcript_126858:127-369(-)